MIILHANYTLTLGTRPSSLIHADADGDCVALPTKSWHGGEGGGDCCGCARQYRLQQIQGEFRHPFIFEVQNEHVP